MVTIRRSEGGTFWSFIWCVCNKMGRECTRNFEDMRTAAGKEWPRMGFVGPVWIHSICLFYVLWNSGSKTQTILLHCITWWSQLSWDYTWGNTFIIQQIHKHMNYTNYMNKVQMGRYYLGDWVHHFVAIKVHYPIRLEWGNKVFEDMHNLL